MPRSPTGTYSLPAGYFVNIGDTVFPSQHNPPLQDIEASLTSSLSRDGLGGMRAPLNMGNNIIRNVAPGVAPTDAANMSQVSGGTPIGAVVEWPGAVETVPAGWLICAGQSVSRTTYAALFAIIGTTYGSNSSSTFNLPDDRGRATVGLDIDAGSGFANRLTVFDNKVVGGVGGVEKITLTEAQMPSHTHTGTATAAGNHFHTLTLSATGNNGSENASVARFNAPTVSNWGQATAVTSYSGDHTHTITITAKGGGGSHDNVQPSISRLKIIKAL